MENNDFKVDIILTSPPYGSSRKVSESYKDFDMHDVHGSHSRYDVFDDCMSVDEYLQFTHRIFKDFDKILKPNGVILYNINYSAFSWEYAKGFFDTLSMINNTNFVIADTITWKKTNALPIQSHNKMSRICEFIFVICRKHEYKTFKTNKKVSSVYKNEQFFEHVTNFVEAKNNDGMCKLNRACFSTDMVMQLLQKYCYSKDCIVYDPFMGTGTTANACIKYGCNYLGTELSQAQCEYAENRLQKTLEMVNMSEDW